MTWWGAGDVDQLPPVGPGRVLSDAIQSGVIPGVDLRQIFRQAQQSNIVRTAHAVNRGDVQAVPLSLPLLPLAHVQVATQVLPTLHTWDSASPLLAVNTTQITYTCCCSVRPFTVEQCILLCLEPVGNQVSIGLWQHVRCGMSPSLL